jgi:hypothetical protein
MVAFALKVSLPVAERIATRPAALNVLGATDRLVSRAVTLGSGGCLPCARRVQDLVDRRFNRARYDIDRIVAGFATRLREEVDLGVLATVVDRTVQPTRAWQGCTYRRPRG